MDVEAVNGRANGIALQRKLRVAMIAPPWFPVPPQGYGGIERVVAVLADGLAGAGIDVTLFAPGGSRTRAQLEVTFDETQPEAMGHTAITTENTIRAYRNWREFDLIHDHTIEGLAGAAHCTIPVVHTIHGPLLSEYRSLYRALPPNVHFVAISKSQQRSVPPECASTVIWNAMELQGLPWSGERGGYLLFVGRACPDKGPLEAAEIAYRAGRPLRMILKVNEPLEHRYFEEIRPRLEAFGAVIQLRCSEAEKWEAYQHAEAVLFPISWPEPFGLVMIESMAAGTPVIAFRNGSVPEIIEDGVTGFICDGIDSAVQAVARVATLSREACRRRVEALFSAEAAVRRHVALYESLVRVREEAAL